MWTETDLAYLAGLIDGEGSFSLYRTKEDAGIAAKGYFWKATLRITTSDDAVVRCLVRKFRGSVGTHISKNGKRPIHQWKALSNLMRDLLPRVLTYLIIKKRHAELMVEALSLLKLRTGGNYGGNRRVRPFENELASLRNELVLLNSFRHRTGHYAYLDVKHDAGEHTSLRIS